MNSVLYYIISHFRLKSDIQWRVTFLFFVLVYIENDVIVFRYQFLSRMSLSETVMDRKFPFPIVTFLWNDNRRLKKDEIEKGDRSLEMTSQ